MARRHGAGMSFGVAVVALLITARAGCQTSEEAAADANFWESHANTRAALLAAGDVDSLEAAALLTPKRSDEQLQLVLRAAAAAPDRPDLAWLALAVCIQVESCDVAPPEARLRALDPGEGSAWMGTLARTAAGTPQFAAAFAGAAGSERVDIYWSPLIVHVAQALMRTRTMEDGEAVVLAIGLGAAQAIPPFRQLVRPCKDVSQPENLGTCRRLSAALRHGDSFLVESLGLSIARRLWPASSDEYRKATEETRVLHYRLRTLGAWVPDLTSEAGANRYLGFLASHRTEQEAVVADLVARGISPSPPAGWTDPAL
jgi:hypothetical protein